MRVLRLVLLFVPVLAIWARPAVAASSFSMNPNPIDVGDVLVGASQNGSGTFDGPGGQYDLALGSSGCGDWTLNTTSANTNPGSVSVSVTFAPTVSGLSQCTVHVYDRGTMNERYTFQLKGNGQKPPKIAVSQPSNFGSLRYNNAAPNNTSQRTVTVNNNGDQDLVISNVAIGGTNAGSFAITSGGTSATITGGTQKQWQITFNPQSPAGAKSANLTFTSNDPANGSVSVSLAGTGTTATIGVLSASIDFGLVNEGSSRAKDITVTNSAPAAPDPTGGPLGVTVGTIATTDSPSWFSFAGCAATATTCTFSPPYAIYPSGSATLPAGSALVGVKCTPPASPDALIHMATVTLTNDGDGVGGNIVTLKCQAGTSKVTASMNTVNFGPQLVTAGGGAPTTMQIVATNTGTVDAALTFAKNSGQPTQFSAGTCNPANCVATANNGTVMVDLTYTPTSEGDVYTSLDINVNGGSGNGPSVSLVGHGIDKHLGPVIDSIVFPDTYRNPGDRTPMQDLVITNTGEYPLTITDISVAGDTSIWSLAEPPANVMVDPLGMTTFHVLFTPVADGKAPDAKLHVMTNGNPLDASQNPIDVQVLLSGNGKLRNVDVAPGSIDIGDTFAGIPAQLSITHPGELFTIVNKDEVAFNVRSLVVEGDAADAFKVIDTSGNEFSPSDIQPGATQQFDIIFAPRYPGDYDATVSLYLDQDPVAQKPVPIHGHAVYVEAYGGGGCSTGGDTGALSVLLVGGLAGLIRRRRR